MIPLFSRGRRAAAMSAVVLFFAALTASAQQLPSYYPQEGFRRTGEVDAVFFDEKRIVIDDLTYILSDAVVVHSPRAFSIPKSRLRQGLTVGFKASDGRQVTEIWLLPRDYQARR